MTWREFILPKMSRKLVLRAAAVAVASYVLFGRVLTPVLIDGASMEPTYSSRGFNFCWRLKYLFEEPGRFDVVMIRLGSGSTMYLKRIVALEGESVEFRDGTLLVNGEPLAEAYVKGPCDWNLPVRMVEKGDLYVVGDNRSVSMDEAYFGETSVKRIMGVPLW